MINTIASILLIIGGLHVGLLALSDFNLIQTICFQQPMIIKTVSILIGAAAVLRIFQWARSR